MHDLALHHIGKTFPPANRILDDVSFRVQAGECLAVLGPSGCGKTSMLRIVAGLETPSAGEVHIGGRSVHDVPSHRRDVAMLFQRPALLPHRSVRQNLGWSTDLRSVWPFGRRSEDADLPRVAKLLDLDRELDRPVRELSGGQQQRVALGRALLRKARVCLLDEPLGHLDAPLRVELRRQIRSLARESGVTLVYVTHDPEEALAIGDQVAVLHGGRIVQIDEPAALRQTPVNRFVAELVCHHQGGLNVVAGTIARMGEEVVFDGPFGRWPVPPLNLDVGTEKIAIMIGIAAGDVRCDNSAGDAGVIRLTLPVFDREISSGGAWVIAGDQRGRLVGRGGDSAGSAEVNMAFSLDRAYWFDVASGQTLSAPAG